MFRRSSEIVPVSSPSWWWTSIGGPPAPRPALEGDRDCDVCIVGGGYTGLWTAYALRRAGPSLDVVVLEAEHVGFGASGRNGGWVLGELSTGQRLRRQAGPAGVEALQRAVERAVDEVVAVCAEEDIDCDLVRGGTLTVAQAAKFCQCSEAHLDNLRSKGGGPRFTRIGGRRIRYLKPDLIAWMRANSRSNTSK